MTFQLRKTGFQATSAHGFCRRVQIHRKIKEHRFGESNEYLFGKSWRPELRQARPRHLHKNRDTKSPNDLPIGKKQFFGPPVPTDFADARPNTGTKCYRIRDTYLRQRPYCVEYTRSHPNSEVKQRKARSVLGWGTAWEALRVPLAF